MILKSEECILSVENLGYPTDFTSLLLCLTYDKTRIPSFKLMTDSFFLERNTNLKLYQRRRRPISLNRRAKCYYTTKGWQVMLRPSM